MAWNCPGGQLKGKNDAYLDEEFINGVYQDLNVEKDLLWIEPPKQKNDLSNRMAAYDWIGDHPDPILDWFDKYLK